MMQLPDYHMYPGSGKEIIWKLRRGSMAIVLVVLVVLCLSPAAGTSQQVSEEHVDEDSPAQVLPPDDRLMLVTQQRTHGQDDKELQRTYFGRQPQRHGGNRIHPRTHKKRPSPSHRRRSRQDRRRPSPHKLKYTTRLSRYGLAARLHRTSRARTVYQRRPRTYQKRPTPPHRRRPNLREHDDTSRLSRYSLSPRFSKGRRQTRHFHKRKANRYQSSRRRGTKHAAPHSDFPGRFSGRRDEVNELKMCNMTSPLGSPRCNRKCIQSRSWSCRKPGACATERRTFSARRLWNVKFESRKCRGKRLLQHKQHDLLYSEWSNWGSCTRSCKQRRRRRCTRHEVCQNSFILETRRCGARGTRCHRRRKTGMKPDAKPGSHADMWGKVENEAGSSDRYRPTKTTNVTSAEDDGASSGSKGKTNKPSRPNRRIKDEQQGDKGNGDDSEREKVGEDVLSALQDTCGIRPPATRGSYRVVGGQEAQRLSWPWQVAILTRWEEQYCAGTLIAPQWVLTAAHCVRKKGRRRRIVVRAGEHNLGEYEATEDDVKPATEFPHPDFDYATITNDIALVRLNRPLRTRTQKVTGFACLPDEHFEPDNDSLCYILGWGKRRNTHLFGAETLHEAKVPRVSHRRCQQAFEYEISNTTQLCAGYKRGGRDACGGDSGGPLLCPKTDDVGVTRWFLMGVTSYGEGCGRKGKFGIYTNVVNYRQWLAQTIGSD